MSYDSRIGPTQGYGVLHLSRAGEPAPVRGAARLLRRRRYPRRGRRAVRVHPLGDGRPGPRLPRRQAGPVRPGPQTRAPPGSAPAKDRVRGRVIELRRQGLSAYEISAHLAGEGTPLNRTSVAEILTEEGFGRLLRHPAPEASTAVATPGRDTNLPAAAALDFAAFPDRCDTTMAGLLLTIPT